MSTNEMTITVNADTSAAMQSIAELRDAVADIAPDAKRLECLRLAVAFVDRRTADVQAIDAEADAALRIAGRMYAFLVEL